VSHGPLRQYVALGRRAVLDTVRKPTSVVPALTFPLLFLALSSAAFDRATSLPGFPPVDSFLQFVVATTIVQGSLFGSVAAGSDMATDIEGGFFDRLVVSPVARTSILVGRVMGSAALGFAQAWIYLGITSLFGLRVEGGVLGMLMIAVVAALLASGIGAVSVAFALRTGSSEAVQGSFPMLFAALFLSSAFFPRSLMDGWFRTVATANPLSHLIEGLRWQVTHGVGATEFLTALAVAGALFALGVGAAGLALRTRLAGA
jgi:ABC-2 type transport system permease protein